MYKIIKNIKLDYKIDYALVYEGCRFFLFEEDWNGEIYVNSTIYNRDTGTYVNTNKSFKPIYKEISEDEFEIIGFEEVY